MAEISVDQSCCTVLEIFNVSPDHQQTLIQALQDFTSSKVKEKPGYIASNLLKSLDGVRVLNYAQWETAAAYQSAQASPDFQANLKPLQSWIEGVDTNTYEVAFTNGEVAMIGSPHEYTVLTNLFSIAGDRQADVLTTLVEFIDPIMRQQAGYLSTNFHRSLDGSRIFNYSYWQSPETYAAAESSVNSQFAGDGAETSMNDARFGSSGSRQNIQVFMSALREGVEKVEPHLYQVVFAMTR